MSGIDIAIVVGVCLAFLAAVGAIAYKKLKHKGGSCCDGSCGSCGMCGMCGEKSDEKKDNEQCCCRSDGKKTP